MTNALRAILAVTAGVLLMPALAAAQIPGFDSLTSLDETMRALDDLVRQGKVRYIGCSNLAAWQVMKAQCISTVRNLEHFVTLQAYYSLVGRDLEREIVPMLKDQGMGLLPWSPLAGGFLSGKYTRDREAAGDGRRSKFDFPPVDRGKGYAIVDALLEVRAHTGASVAQLALAWLLHQPHVTSIIIGAKNAEQLKDNLGAVDVKLAADDLERIDKLSALTPEYPGWMFAMQGTDRRPGQSRDWSKMMKT